MATATAYKAVNMDVGYDFNGEVTFTSATQIQITYGAIVENYYGTFSYNPYGLAGGTVTQFNHYESGVKIVEVTGLSHDVLMWEYYDNIGYEAVVPFMFAGNDTFIGSPYGDVLNGYNGNDEMNGNTGADTLYGGTGNDMLNGGPGIDTMIGGQGNDTYYVDNTEDITTETSSLATEVDTVFSSITRTLGANFEKMTLTGTAAINGTGNELNNTLMGNSADNTLDGGTGNDTMLGGLGNDIYLVNATGDVVTEEVNQGIDTVKSAISYTLSANVEKLALTGSAAINGIGNTLANTLTGNNGANALNGMAGADTILGGLGNDYLNGGLGNDSLSGGAGRDIFLFNSALGANIDRIKDFIAIDDIIRLDQTVFSSLTNLGTLSGTGFFRSSTTGAAADANDYILYNRSTGALFYDADGSGAGGAIQFATLTGKPTITAADFAVVA